MSDYPVDPYPKKLSTFTESELLDVVPDGDTRSRLCWYLMGEGWRLAEDAFKEYYEGGQFRPDRVYKSWSFASYSTHRLKRLTFYDLHVWKNFYGRRSHEFELWIKSEVAQLYPDAKIEAIMREFAQAAWCVVISDVSFPEGKTGELIPEEVVGFSYGDRDDRANSESGG